MQLYKVIFSGQSLSVFSIIHYIYVYNGDLIASPNLSWTVKLLNSLQEKPQDAGEPMKLLDLERFKFEWITFF